MACVLSVATNLSLAIDRKPGWQDPAAMCFRYSAKKNEARIKAREREHVFGLAPRENIRPTDYGPVLLPEEDHLLAQGRAGNPLPADGGASVPASRLVSSLAPPSNGAHGVTRPTNVPLEEERKIICMEMRWGWKVPWDKSPLVNARSETITQVATFKPHLQNRCLILADGFYEKGIRFIQPGEPVFCMAGLWCEELSASPEIPRPRERERMSEGQVRVVGENHSEAARQTRFFTMLTTTPNDSVKPYHHRMPLIVRPEFYDAWLGNDWQTVLENPDKGPLEKLKKQPELF